jgi:hypothetical protein
MRIASCMSRVPLMPCQERTLNANQKLIGNQNENENGQFVNFQFFFNKNKANPSPLLLLLPPNSILTQSCFKKSSTIFLTHLLNQKRLFLPTNKKHTQPPSIAHSIGRFGTMLGITVALLAKGEGYIVVLEHVFDLTLHGEEEEHAKIK